MVLPAHAASKPDRPLLVTSSTRPGFWSMGSLVTGYVGLVRHSKQLWESLESSKTRVCTRQSALASILNRIGGVHLDGSSHLFARGT